MGGKSTTEKKEQGLIKYFQLHEIEFLKKKFTESAVSINGNAVLIEKNFLDFFPENKTLGRNLFDFFLNVNGKIQEKALNFDSYCNGVKLLIKDNFDNQDQTYEKFNAEKIEMLFLILLNCKDFQERNQIILDLNQVKLLLQSVLLIFLPDFKPDEDQFLNNLTQSFLEIESSITFSKFISKLKAEFIYLNKFVRLYFSKKLLHTDNYIIELPKLLDNSSLLTPKNLVLYMLTNDSFHNLSTMPLLYSPAKGTSFNRLTHSILGYEGPTIILIKHLERNDRENQNKDTPYIFGAYSKLPWKEELNYIGDHNCFLFKLSPRFHNFFSYKGEGGTNFAYLNTKRIEKSKYKVGLGFGGFNFEDYRLWIDDDIETKSYVNYDDKTYEKGPLADFHINKLNVEGIEIWGVGGESALKGQELYRENERLQIENMRKVDKKAFFNSFDKSTILEKTFAHQSQVQGDITRDDEEQKK